MKKQRWNADRWSYRINQLECLHHYSCWMVFVGDTKKKQNCTFRRHCFRPMNQLTLHLYQIIPNQLNFGSTSRPAVSTDFSCDQRVFPPATPAALPSRRQKRNAYVSADARTQTQRLSNTKWVELHRLSATNNWFPLKMKQQKYNLVTFHCDTDSKSVCVWEREELSKRSS